MFIVCESIVLFMCGVLSEWEVGLDTHEAFAT